MEHRSGTDVYWTKSVEEGWFLILAATEKGLCYASTRELSPEELGRRIGRLIPGSRLVQHDAKLEPYVKSYLAYFKGIRTSFTCSLDLRGTPFQMSVWEAIRKIPYGERRSYAEIAVQIRKPSAVRAVAAAIGANPVLIVIPCHRVLGKDGSLTGYRDGIDMKSRLLQLEQFIFETRTMLCSENES